MRSWSKIFVGTLTLILTTTAQGKEILPTENLITEQIPPIPESISNRVEPYTQFRSARFRSWHPIHREMLISTRFSETSQIHQVKFPQGSRQQLTFFAERVSNVTYQPTHGQYFILSKDIGGNEFRQNYRYDLDTRDITLLTDGESKNSLGTWSNDGRTRIYTSNRRNGKDADLYLVDPLNPESDRLFATVEGGGWFPIEWSPDDQQILVVEYVSANESYLWLFDVKSGTKKPITQKDEGETIAYGGATFSKDGKGLYLTTDRESEFLRLAYLDFATQDYTYLLDQASWNVEEFDLSQDGKWLAFTTNEEGISILYLLNLETGEKSPVSSLPVGLILDLNWHNNSQDLGFTLLSSQSTADAYSLNRITGEMKQWTASETGRLDTSTFVEPDVVRWQSFDQRVISGFLYRPPAKFKGKRPVIINIHGGPESQYRPRFLGRRNFYINELGVALLFPNVRGSSGYGKTFLKLDNGYLREDAVKDIGALLDWIATQPDLDSDRILVTGGSYGGYMSLAVATQYGDRIRAAIDIVGISNFVSFLERTQSYRRDLRRVEYGDERDPQMRAFLQRISPLNNAEKITTPLLVVHGQNDPRVPVYEAQQIAETVGNNGTPVWSLIATDEGHGFAKKKNADYLFYTTVLFIQEYLLGWHWEP